jgi:hypothetical protein
MGTKMIFRDEYTGQQSEIFNKLKFKEFTLYDDAKYTTRSLELIYPMYCQWLNTRHGIYLTKVKLSISDEANLCSESLIDYLFHRVQGDIESRQACSDKSIGLVWKTYREGASTIHEGLFLIPMTEAEMNESPRGEKAKVSRDVSSIFELILVHYDYRLYGQLLGDDDEKPIELEFRHSKFGEGHRVIFSDSSLKMHEQGFNTLCDFAELPDDAESALFRVRNGYNPAHNYFNTSLFEPFFITMY